MDPTLQGDRLPAARDNPHLPPLIRRDIHGNDCTRCTRRALVAGRLRTGPCARWKALDFEQAAADRGLVATALRNFAEWDATPQGQAVAAQPVMTLTRIGDAPPLALPTLADSAPPLAGVRVLDLTRILAGPVGGRTLAAFGADVMLVNSPNLPNIDAIADTSRGKRSAHVTC